LKVGENARSALLLPAQQWSAALSPLLKSIRKPQIECRFLFCVTVTPILTQGHTHFDFPETGGGA
jgi:hypothetical protein